MRITIETEAADELVLDMRGADKDRKEAVIRLTDMTYMFRALKSEAEFHIRLASGRDDDAK